MGGALLLWGLQLAVGARILLPPWPLSPDGETVAVDPAGAALAAERARAESLGGGLWRVTPDPGAGEVRLLADGAEQVARVEPPPGRIVVRTDPPRPVKGRDARVALTLEVLDAGGRPDPSARPPVLACSTGTVGEVAPVGPGRFAASYQPSSARYPEVAVITAVSPRCPLCPTPRAVGAAVLPVAARTEVPGRTEPRVQVTVEVAGRRFGPVTADASGRFLVPVEVPPGERFGRGVSIDRLGNRRAEELDLRLPPVRQLACASWPARLPADGRSEAGIWCVATDSRGRRASGARLEISARRGSISPISVLENGLFHARYRAPRGGGGGIDRIAASYPEAGAVSALAIEMGLATGAPAELGWSLAREPVPLGSSTPVRTWARDARGDPLPAPSGPPGAAEGFVSPHRFVARTKPGGWVQRSELRLALPPSSSVAELWLARQGGEWVAAARDVDGRPAVGVPLTFGSGAVVATDSRGEARSGGGGDEETVRAPGGARAAGWAGRSVPAPPVQLSVVAEVPLVPELPVDVRAVVDSGLLRWRVTGPDGKALPDRPVRVESGGPRLGPVEPDGEGGRCRVEGRGTVTVVDEQTGLAAVVELR